MDAGVLGRGINQVKNRASFSGSAVPPRGAELPAAHSPILELAVPPHEVAADGEGQGTGRTTV